jgi:hypothetical protein
MALAAAVLSMTAAAQTPARDPPLPGEYRVVAGRVDRGTYLGWRMFHTACYGCHGSNATGTDVAPNLVERVKTMTPRAFVTKVFTSYRLVVPSSEAAAEGGGAAREAMIDEVLRQQRGAAGQIIMPAWESDELVSPHVLDLYAYLSARADGKLGPGRPKLIRSGTKPKR